MQWERGWKTLLAPCMKIGYCICKSSIRWWTCTNMSGIGWTHCTALVPSIRNLPWQIASVWRICIKESYPFSLILKELSFGSSYKRVRMSIKVKMPSVKILSCWELWANAGICLSAHKTSQCHHVGVNQLLMLNLMTRFKNMVYKSILSAPF